MRMRLIAKGPTGAVKRKMVEEFSIPPSQSALSTTQEKLSIPYQAIMFIADKAGVISEGPIFRLITGKSAPDGGWLDEGDIVSRMFFVAGCQCSGVFDPAEETLDLVAILLEQAGEGRYFSPVGRRLNGRPITLGSENAKPRASGSSARSASGISPSQSLSAMSAALRPS